MFVDRARIQIKAGDGGNGCESYYYAKPMRHRRRDGGDGGNGGSVIVKTDSNVNTLIDFRFRQHFLAERGKNGSSKQKRGRDGADLYIVVPPGTVLRESLTGSRIRDLEAPGEEVIVARGGRGGIGNAKKRVSTEGGTGEELEIQLELKLIADIGLLGFPNAGKSSLLNSVSAAHSRVANFPFTTLNPILGVIPDPDKDRNLIVADVPGIIEDAHKGKGLGTRFLRHVERTRMLVMVIDSQGWLETPLDDYQALRREMSEYGEGLDEKPRIIVFNKIDIEGAIERLDSFRRSVRERIFPISATSGLGIEDLIEYFRGMEFA